VTIWTIVPAALALDAALGDPPRLPHPTRAIGALASRIERPLRKLLPPLVAGALGWLIVVGTAAAIALALPSCIGGAARALCVASGFAEAAPMVRAICEWIASVWLVYVSIAPRDLAAHALRVSKALRSGGDAGLTEGRKAVSMIVGRDVERLDEAGVVRAAVESVAESTVDGVCAPLFWALILGPAGAFAYRAANTLDSMWGYKSDRYILYGRVAARADDVLSWLPCRIAFFCSIAAAALLAPATRGRCSPSGALRYGWRDKRKHESPNAAWLEAAFAGALGIRLGGDAWYGGRVLPKSHLGEAARACEEGDIGRSVFLMYATTLVFASLGALALILAGAPMQ
jgi:adenosylcobinamide-phosphate synthase